MRRGLRPRTPEGSQGLSLAPAGRRSSELARNDEHDGFRLAEQLRQAPVTSKQARDYLRVFLSGASDEVPDKQGRITIPPNLREYAGLSKDCVVIGASTRVEIWDKQAWDTYLAESEDDFADIEEGVLPGGL